MKKPPKAAATKPPSPPRGPATPDPPAHLSAAAKLWWVKIVSEFDLEDASLLILENVSFHFPLSHF